MFTANNLKGYKTKAGAEVKAYSPFRYILLILSPAYLCTDVTTSNRKTYLYSPSLFSLARLDWGVRRSLLHQTVDMGGSKERGGVAGNVRSHKLTMRSRPSGSKVVWGLSGGKGVISLPWEPG